MAELFESYERRLPQINAKLAEYGIASIEEAEKITKDAGLDVYHLIEGIQPICFENAKWAYTVGAAIAIKKGCTKAADAAAAIGIVAKKPDQFGKAMLFPAMVETYAIFAFVVSILIWSNIAI